MLFYKSSGEIISYYDFNYRVRDTDGAGASPERKTGTAGTGWKNQSPEARKNIAPSDEDVSTIDGIAKFNDYALFSNLIEGCAVTKFRHILISFFIAFLLPCVIDARDFCTVFFCQIYI